MSQGGRSGGGERGEGREGGEKEEGEELTWRPQPSREDQTSRSLLRKYPAPACPPGCCRPARPFLELLQRWSSLSAGSTGRGRSPRPGCKHNTKQSRRINKMLINNNNNNKQRNSIKHAQKEVRRRKMYTLIICIRSDLNKKNSIYYFLEMGPSIQCRKYSSENV